MKSGNPYTPTTYKLKFVLTDNYRDPGVTIYVLYLEVPILPLPQVIGPANLNQTLKTNTTNTTAVFVANHTNNKTSTPPYWKSITVSNRGLVTIKFSEPLNIPNITNINGTVLDV